MVLNRNAHAGATSPEAPSCLNRQGRRRPPHRDALLVRVAPLFAARSQSRGPHPGRRSGGASGAAPGCRCKGTSNRQLGGMRDALSNLSQCR